MKTREVQGYISAIFAAFFYATMICVVKLAKDINFETLVFFRTFICSCLILPFCIKKKNVFATKKIGLHVLRAFVGIGALYCSFFAAKHLPIVDVVLLFNTLPFFIPIIVFLWHREKISWKRILAILMGFIGVIFVLRPDFSFINIPGFIGLASGLLGAMALVTVHRLAKTEPIETILFYFFLFFLCFLDGKQFLQICGFG